MRWRDLDTCLDLALSATSMVRYGCGGDMFFSFHDLPVDEGWMQGSEFLRNTVGTAFDSSAHSGWRWSWGFDTGEIDGNEGLLVLVKVARVFLSWWPGTR